MVQCHIHAGSNQCKSLAWCAMHGGVQPVMEAEGAKISWKSTHSVLTSGSKFSLRVIAAEVCYRYASFSNTASQEAYGERRPANLNEEVQKSDLAVSNAVLNLVEHFLRYEMAPLLARASPYCGTGSGYISASGLEKRIHRVIVFWYGILACSQWCARRGFKATVIFSGRLPIL